MTDATDAVDALVAAVDDRGEVAGDGLTVASEADGYAVETPDAERTGLAEAGLRGVLADHRRLVVDWHHWDRIDADADRAFLRWVERADERSVADRYDALADGVTREWGQLHVRARLADESTGDRRYAVRHVDDADAAAADLTAYDDPLDLRRPTKFDDRGRYRPLRTAPTLPTGWHLPDLRGPELVEAVDVVYPATVANWHREREGDLDVDHWRETVERQTGIYGLVKTWDRQEGHDHVDWVAEACCDDSQCLKRREWEYDEETDLDVDGGDGVFPCREPCSLVIAAAREWTRLEGEESRTYEFELTPSEKEQVEAVIDAVADGRTDAIREADFDDPANRYRVRFLRAKRFDDEGRLGGVPTED